MADDRIRLPSSGAGITTFSEEYKSRFTIGPYGVLIFIAAIIAFALILRVVA